MDEFDELAALAAEIAETEGIDATAAELLAIRIYDAIVDYADSWNDRAARMWSRQRCDGLALVA